MTGFERRLADEEGIPLGRGTHRPTCGSSRRIGRRGHALGARRPSAVWPAAHSRCSSCAGSRQRPSNSVDRSAGDRARRSMSGSTVASTPWPRVTSTVRGLSAGTKPVTEFASDEFGHIHRGVEAFRDAMVGVLHVVQLRPPTHSTGSSRSYRRTAGIGRRCSSPVSRPTRPRPDARRTRSRRRSPTSRRARSARCR